METGKSPGLRKREKKKMSLPTIVIGLDRKVRTASAVIAIHVGSQDEFAGTFGLAHVLEHMMFRGTTKRPSQVDFLLPFLYSGAKFNGETGRDRTMYYVTSLPNQLLKIFPLLIEMVKQPLFDPTKFEVEKKAVLNELKSMTSQPSSYLNNELLLPNVLKADFPSYHAPIGVSKDVEQCTYEDMIELYQSVYTDPTRIVISLYGDLNEENLYNQVKKLWDSIPYKYPAVTPVESLKRKSVLKQSLQDYLLRTPHPLFPLVRRPHLSQCYVALGWESAPMDSFASYVLSWISSYLTGDLMASLYYQLRVKRGLVYQISSSEYGLATTGVFSIKFQTPQPQNIKLAIDLICQQLKELKDFHDEKQLQIWKHWLTTRLQMNQDLSVSTAKMYAQQMLIRGQIRPLQEIIQILKSLTCQDIRDVSCKVFDRPMTVAIMSR